MTPRAIFASATDLRRAVLPAVPNGRHIVLTLHGRPRFYMVPCTPEGRPILSSEVVQASVPPEDEQTATN